MRTDLNLKWLLKLFFSEFMHLFFPRFAARIDWSKPYEFLDKELASITGESIRTVDILVRVITLSGETECCLIHIEIEGRKSRVALGVRLHRYLVKLEEKFGLPVVSIAMFLHVGGQGLGWGERKLMCFGECIVHFIYPYVGLPALDGTQYLQVDNPLAWALLGFMNVPPEQRARIKAESLRRIERRKLDAERRAIAVKCVEAFTVLDAEQKREYEALLQSPEYRKERTMQKTIYDEAEELGEERGQLRASRHLLLLQLEAKFGPLSARARKKVERMQADEFDDFATRLVTANDRRELGL